MSQLSGGLTGDVAVLSEGGEWRSVEHLVGWELV